MMRKRSVIVYKPKVGVALGVLNRMGPEGVVLVVVAPVAEVPVVEVPVGAVLVGAAPDGVDPVVEVLALLGRAEQIVLVGYPLAPLRVCRVVLQVVLGNELDEEHLVQAVKPNENGV